MIRANPPAVKVHFGPALESPDKSYSVGIACANMAGLSDPLRGFLAPRPPAFRIDGVIFGCRARRHLVASASPSPQKPHFRYAFSRNAARSAANRSVLQSCSYLSSSPSQLTQLRCGDYLLLYGRRGRASLLTYRPFSPVREPPRRIHWALCRRKNSILTRGTRHHRRRRAKLRLEEASPSARLLILRARALLNGLSSAGRDQRHRTMSYISINPPRRKFVFLRDAAVRSHAAVGWLSRT